VSAAGPARVAASALIALAILGAIHGQAASARPSSSHVVDRTLARAMGIWGGVRKVELRTESRKPLAYGTADATGKARLLLAKGCGPS
jgi:hypothetical protein